MEKQTDNPQESRPDYRSGVLSKINTKFFREVKAKSSIEGGETGEEFTGNLLVPGDSPGNKWYDPYNHATWIELNLTSPREVAMFGLKSANDCPERDPSFFSFYGITETGQKYLLYSASEVEFEERYQWKMFIFNNISEVRAFSTYFLDIGKNKNFDQEGNWGSGTQLAEICLYEPSRTSK